jgi:hypothetical protein
VLDTRSFDADDLAWRRLSGFRREPDEQAIITRVSAGHTGYQPGWSRC